MSYDILIITTLRLENIMLSLLMNCLFLCFIHFIERDLKITGQK